MRTSSNQQMAIYSFACTLLKWRSLPILNVNILFVHSLSYLSRQYWWQIEHDVQDAYRIL